MPKLSLAKLERHLYSAADRLDACKDLSRHFNKYQLRKEDFQFSDLLGAAYEFLINMFAESAGKKGGAFYTPRDVIRLMVRILRPKPGLSVYDPCCGSGGMLIISREFIELPGGDPTNIRLCGQVNDASAWSICKLNMLLHGVPGADVRFNWKLLQLPVRVTDYVITYELAHLLQPHHGPEFWKIFDRSLPDWRDRSEDLKVRARTIYWCNDRMNNR